SFSGGGALRNAGNRAGAPHRPALAQGAIMTSSRVKSEAGIWKGVLLLLLTRSVWGLAGVRAAGAQTPPPPEEEKPKAEEPKEAGNAIDEELQRVAEEITVTGTRVEGRSATDTPAPVDYIDAATIQSTGAVETGKILQLVAPSFNFSATTISDGTDIIRPATLRSLGSDQVLVLVNGKR